MIEKLIYIVIGAVLAVLACGVIALLRSSRARRAVQAALQQTRREMDVRTKTVGEIFGAFLKCQSDLTVLPMKDHGDEGDEDTEYLQQHHNLRGMVVRLARILSILEIKVILSEEDMRVVEDAGKTKGLREDLTEW